MCVAFLCVTRYFAVLFVTCTMHWHSYVAPPLYIQDVIPSGCTVCQVRNIHPNGTVTKVCGFAWLVCRVVLHFLSFPTSVVVLVPFSHTHQCTLPHLHLTPCFPNNPGCGHQGDDQPGCLPEIRQQQLLLPQCG